MNRTETGRHPDDGALLRYLDGEAPAGERAGWAHHIEACAECSEAVDRLREESDRIGAWLDRAAFEELLHTAEGQPTRSGPAEEDEGAPSARAAGLARAAGPWLRAAAILVLVAAPVAALPGVRAWIAERVAGGPAESVVAPAMEAVDAPTVIRFTPDPGEFEVRFQADSPGTLTIERSADAEAVLRVTGGDAAAVVSPSGLRISSSGAGHYHLRLPELTSGLWVRVGDRAVAITGRQIDRRAVVELATL